MNIKRVSLKVSPEASLRVSAARQSTFIDMMEKEALVVLGSKRRPEVIQPAIAPGPTTLFGPRGACLTDEEGPFVVCDTGHHRLLGWSQLPEQDLTPADWFLGQKDFYSEGRNGHADIGPSTLNVPTGICAAGSGIAVGDAWNHRVLIWHKVPRRSNEPADVVLGQKDFTHGESNRGTNQANAGSMHWPYGVHYENGKLYVADTGNRRVLVWNKMPHENGQPADLVLGQTSFNSRDENAGFDPSAMSMRWPHGITFCKNNLCVSDAGNNRVLIWIGEPAENGQPADFILGQSDPQNVDFNRSLYWPRSNSLNMPYGITAKNDWLIIADTANSRLLAWNISDFDTIGDALALFGQKDFHEKGDNRWQAPVEDSICWPYGVQALKSLAVVADSGNNRVSVWKLKI
ncbi:MAG: NHL repeat-containing protein [Candidatus Obscuribacterales bacterium]|nr:NHL repeat-containing protein [Candidatus Obscuribacterales bacterium]